MEKKSRAILLLLGMTLFFTGCSTSKPGSSYLTSPMVSVEKQTTSNIDEEQLKSTQSSSPDLADEVKNVNKADLEYILSAVETCLKDIAYSGGESSYIVEMKSLMGHLEPLQYEEELNKYINTLLKLLTSIINYNDENANEFKQYFSEYKALKNSNSKINVSDLEYFLAVSSIREKDRLTDNEIVLSFAGDCSFGTYPQAKEKNTFDYVMENIANNDLSYNFKNCLAYFRNDDLTILNNESAISERTKMQNKAWQIKSNPAFTPIYTAGSVEVVNLANNHTFDCFEEGFQDTLKSLDENNIGYFYTDAPYITNIKNIDIVLLGYSVLSRQASNKVKDRIVNDVLKYKKSDNIVIVNMHWGTEYKEQPDPYQKEYAYAFIDAGADMIVGMHPHIMQGIEKYKNKYILYSLGDFCFGGDPDLKSRMTAVFRARINSKTREISLEVVPFYENSDGIEKGYNNFQPLPLYGAEAKSVLDYLKRISQPLDGGVTKYSVFDPFS